MKKIILTLILILIPYNISFAVNVAYVEKGQGGTKDSTIINWLTDDLGYTVVRKAYADSLRNIGSNWNSAYQLVVISLDRLSSGAYTDTIFKKPIPVLTMHHGNYNESHMGSSASWVLLTAPVKCVKESGTDFVRKTENDTTFLWNTNMYLGKMVYSPAAAEENSVINYTNWRLTDSSLYIYCDSGAALYDFIIAPQSRCYFGLLADSSGVPANWNWCSAKRIFLREVARMTKDTTNVYFSKYTCFSDNEIADNYTELNEGGASWQKLNVGGKDYFHIGKDVPNWRFMAWIRPETSMVNKRISVPNVASDSAKLFIWRGAQDINGTWRCSVGVARILTDTQWVEGTGNAPYDTSTEANNWSNPLYAKYTEWAWVDTGADAAGYDRDADFMDTIYYQNTTWATGFFDTLHLSPAKITEQLNGTKAPNGFWIGTFWTSVVNNDSNFELKFYSTERGGADLNKSPRIEYWWHTVTPPAGKKQIGSIIQEDRKGIIEGGIVK
ncbi:MAG: hypothetical protein MUO85_01160 [candidate division Zixibacteria bacterium]|nr:hypothetical protein [candidate division Zixibacteria bacterium]